MQRLYFLLVCVLTVLNGPKASAQWSAASQLVVGTDTASEVYSIKGYGNKLFACTNKGLFVSADNGNSWTNLTFGQVTTYGLPIRAVCFDLATGKLYAGSDYTIYRSTDTGATWSTTGMPNVDRVNDIEMNGSTVLASWGSFTNGGVYYSLNAMTAAVAATAPNLPMTDFQYVGSTLFVGGASGAYKSTDNGHTWVLAGTGHPASGKYQFMTMSGSSLFGGDVFGTGLYKSTDTGLVWSRTDTAVFTGFCQLFSLTSAGGLILVTVDGNCNNSYPVKASTDNGVTFTGYMTGLPVDYYSMCGRNSTGSCFFVFNHNLKKIYKTCPAMGLTEEQKGIANITLSPNPASSKITLAFGQTNEAVNIRVLSMEGKLMYQQQLKDMQTADINVAGLAPGLYFVQISTATDMKTLKFIKE